MADGVTSVRVNTSWDDLTMTPSVSGERLRLRCFKLVSGEQSKGLSLHKNRMAPSASSFVCRKVQITLSCFPCWEAELRMCIQPEMGRVELAVGGCEYMANEIHFISKCWGREGRCSRDIKELSLSYTHVWWRPAIPATRLLRNGLRLIFTVHLEPTGFNVKCFVNVPHPWYSPRDKCGSHFID